MNAELQLVPEIPATDAPRIILGLDPGSGRTGFGAISCTDDQVDFIECGCLSTSQKDCREMRLRDLFEQLCVMFDRVQPHVAVVEELFFNRNVTTAMVVGEARGVILLVAAQRNIPVVSYTASAVKQAVTGSGNAKKNEVCFAVMQYLDLEVKPKPDDASDGLAIAICHKFWEDLEPS